MTIKGKKQQGWNPPISADEPQTVECTRGGQEGGGGAGVVKRVFFNNRNIWTTEENIHGNNK